MAEEPEAPFSTIRRQDAPKPQEPESEPVVEEFVPITPLVKYDPEANIGSIRYSLGDGYPVLQIQFQNGPIQENGYNGVQNEDLLNLLLLRMAALQALAPCRENALAITKMEEALMWLMERTRKRREQGVEGTSSLHR